MSAIRFTTNCLDSDDATRRFYDLGVWFCGYEERSPWLVNSRFRPTCVTRWLHVEVEEDRCAHRARENLARAKDGLFGERPAKRNWDGYWRVVWRTEIRDAARRAGRPVRVFVDISSMPRTVYGPLLIEACRDSDGMVSEIVLSYVPGEHRGIVSGHQQLDGLRTLAGLEGASHHDRDPALVLGLGYDGVLADTIVDLFQLEHVSCFYADPGVSEYAADRCRRENVVLLTCAELVETAAVGDMTSWISCLERLVSWYQPSRDVFILPIGPKPQVVASILFSLQNPAVGFRCLRASITRPIDVGVPADAEPFWMSVAFVPLGFVEHEQCVG